MCATHIPQWTELFLIKQQKKNQWLCPSKETLVVLGLTRINCAYHNNESQKVANTILTVAAWSFGQQLVASVFVEDFSGRQTFFSGCDVFCLSRLLALVVQRRGQNQIGQIMSENRRRADQNNKNQQHDVQNSLYITCESYNDKKLNIYFRVTGMYILLHTTCTFIRTYII